MEKRDRFIAKLGFNTPPLAARNTEQKLDRYPVRLRRGSSLANDRCHYFMHHCDFVMGADETKNNSISELYSEKKIDDNVQGSSYMPEESTS